MFNLSSLFNTFFKKTPESVLGVDIGSSAIKVVQLRKKNGKAILETYGELSLGPYAGTEIGRATNLPQEKIVEALKDLIKEANVSTTVCGMSIPASASLISFIKMPTSDPRQLETAVPLEARKYIPVPITEVSLNWSVIPENVHEFTNEFEAHEEARKTDGPQSSEVLLAVIHNDVLSKYNQILRDANLQTNALEIEIFSSMRAIIEQSLDAELVFDMGAGSTKLYIIDRNVLHAAHTVNRGSQEITLALSRSLSMSVGDAEHIKRTVGISNEPEKRQVREVISLNLDYVFTETNRVILNYQKKTGKNVSRVILTGGGSLLKGFLELARAKFQIEVVLGDPFAKTETPAFLEPVLKAAGPGFAVAIGLALKQLQD
jgi:type IV pilus assembly protein PilM